MNKWILKRRYFITEVNIIHGWVLTYQDNADIVVAVNQAGNVAITYATKFRLYYSPLLKTR